MGRLARDFTRNNLAMIAAIVIGFIFLGVYLLMDGELLELQGRRFPQRFVPAALVPFYLVTWAAYCLIASLLTHIVYFRIPDDDLAERSLDGNEGFSLTARLMGASGAASLAVQATVVSGLLALFIARSDAYAGNDLVTVLVLLSVVGSWLNVVYFYALHYLRLWARGVPVDLGLAPDEHPQFVDFLHFSISVATQFGATMQWREREGRRAVALHAVLSLLFNTIILAITVTLVLR